MKLAAQAQLETSVIESPTPGQIVDIFVDNGSTLPPGVGFSDLPTATGPFSVVPTADAVIPPGTNDVVLPAVSIADAVIPQGTNDVVLPAVPTADAVIPPGTNDVVLPAATLPSDNSLNGVQIGSSILPVTRSLSGIGGVLAAGISSAIRGLPLASGTRLPIIPPVGPGLPASTANTASIASTASTASSNGIGGFGSFALDEPEVQAQDGIDQVAPVTLDDSTDGLIGAADAANATPAPATVDGATNDAVGDTGSNLPSPTDSLAPAPAENNVNDASVLAAPVPIANTNNQPVSGLAIADDQAGGDALSTNALDDPSAQPPLPDEGVVPNAADVPIPVSGDETPVPPTDSTPIQATAPGDTTGLEANAFDSGLQPPASGDNGVVGATGGQPSSDAPPYDPFTGANDGPYIPQQPPIGPSGYDGDDNTQYDAEGQGSSPHGRRPGQDPKDPSLAPYSSGNDVEDTTEYDGEDYGNGPNGQSKSHGKNPTKGNGPDHSGDDSEEECPEWCLENDDSSSPEPSSDSHHGGKPSDDHSSTSSADHAKETGGKRKHKKKKSKKSSKTPHRIAVTVDDNVVYTSDYKREVTDGAPSSGGFTGFKWPSKKISDSSEGGDDSQGSQGQSQDKPSEGQGQDKDSSASGSSQNDKEISDQLQKGSKGQRTGENDSAADSGDGVSGSALPDWLNDLQKPKESGSPDSAKNSTASSSGAKDSSGTSSGSENNSTKGKKKKSKGKCPKSCKNKKGSKPSKTSDTGLAGKPSDEQPSGSAPGGQPTGAPLSSEAPSVEGAPTAVTGTPDFAAPTTFVTLASEKEGEAPATEVKGGDSPEATGDAGKGGLPAGKEDSGDTFTGSTLAGVCPKQCNPFNPAENLCDHESSGCTTAGGSKYYCACRAGYKLSDSSNKDFSKQFKVPGQPYVYVFPGAKCDKQCDDGLCDEVMVREHCV
ncbi:hypothetical protein SLS60_010606 [Paraconiothyrium brasiliense]|uniref:EGF-like domain-containing protein n=1 Tax=Paraconiothyrium brasiliense TaxID=300254 RepID=A0ABR3QNX9_9PLEO